MQICVRLCVSVGKRPSLTITENRVKSFFFCSHFPVQGVDVEFVHVFPTLCTSSSKLIRAIESITPGKMLMNKNSAPRPGIRCDADELKQIECKYKFDKMQ